MPKSPAIEIIARGLLTHQGRILLCRNVEHGYLYLPGGHVEFAESARAALEREMMEECALPVKAGRLLLTSEEHFRDYKDREHHEINLVFHMEQSGRGAPLDHIESRETDIAFDWVEMAQLHETVFYPTTIKAWLMSGGGVDPAHGPMVSSFNIPQPITAESNTTN